MKIRAYEENDRVAVIELWKACGLVVPQNDPSRDIDRKLLVDPDLFLVGDESGEVVAMVMGGNEGHRGWINYVAVKPSARRRGYGKQILHAVEERIRSKGCPKINLQVRESNTSIIAFYNALGYDDGSVVGLGKRFESS